MSDRPPKCHNCGSTAWSYDVKDGVIAATCYGCDKREIFSAGGWTVRSVNAAAAAHHAWRYAAARQRRLL